MLVLLLILQECSLTLNSNNENFCQIQINLLLRHDEVKQAPQLFEAVLQGRASDEQPVVCVKLKEGLVQQRVIILKPVGLIHH